MLMTPSELVWFVTCPPVYGRNPLSRMAHLRHAFADMVFRRLAGVDHLRFASENIVAPALYWSLVPKQQHHPSPEVPVVTSVATDHVMMLVPKQKQHLSQEVLVLTSVATDHELRTWSVSSDPWAFPFGRSCALPRE